MSAAFSGVIESSNEVDRNNLIKRFTVKVFWSDAAHISYACVVDKDIYSSMHFDTCTNDVLHDYFYGNIDRDRCDFTNNISAIL